LEQKETVGFFTKGKMTQVLSTIRLNKKICRNEVDGFLHQLV